jgi:hypothetical protein
MSDTFNIIVGDWSDDGHGKTDTQLVTTVTTFSDVQNAWTAVNKNLKNTYGFTLEDVCQDYEDNLLTKQQSDAFIAMGINLSEFAEDAEDYVEDGESEFALDSDSFVELVIRLINQHNPLLGLSKAPYSHRKDLRVGGYGLFL